MQPGGGPLATTVGIPLLTASAAAMHLGVALGAALAQAGYVALGLCTLALPLVDVGNILPLTLPV